MKYQVWPAQPVSCAADHAAESNCAVEPTKPLRLWSQEKLKFVSPSESGSWLPCPAVGAAAPRSHIIQVYVPIGAAFAVTPVPPAAAVNEKPLPMIAGTRSVDAMGGVAV